MKTNTSKRISFYTQGQQFVARVLFIVWLLVSGSPDSLLATTPKRQPTMTSASTTNPRDPLSGALPTPPPGGISQLPTGSPWRSSVASNTPIDEAPQRQQPPSLFARTVDKLMSFFWGPRPKEAPRTPGGGPVGEGITEGAIAAAPADTARQALKAHYQERFSEVPSFFPDDPKTPIGQDPVPPDAPRAG